MTKLKALRETTNVDEYRNPFNVIIKGLNFSKSDIVNSFVERCKERLPNQRSKERSQPVDLPWRL